MIYLSDRSLNSQKTQGLGVNFQDLDEDRSSAVASPSVSHNHWNGKLLQKQKVTQGKMAAV